MKPITRIPAGLVWLWLALIIFIPRLLNLDVFLTADEPLFLEQARQFATGLAGGDYSKTLGIGYPGVTVAWWSAPVIGWPATELGAYAAGRLATALVTGLLLLVLYVLTRRLLGEWPALLAVGLLALDPYTLAYSRLLHIAAPLALFMTLAGVSFLLWLREVCTRWLFLAGFLAGLALLTKSTALLLGPMLVVGLLGWGIAAGRFHHRRWWLEQMGGLLLVATVAALIFYALWPAMWVDPSAALNLTFGKLFTDQEAGTGNLGMFWLGRFVEDPGPAFYPVAFLLKATPWLMLGLAASLVFLYRSKFVPAPPAGAGERHDLGGTQPPIADTVFLWLFALTYLLLMTIASKKSIRYMLPVFPVFYILAGQGLHWLGRETNRRIFARRTRPKPLALRVIALTLLVAGLVLFTFTYHPYYFTYYNPLLLGWRWAPQTLLVGWGEGLDEAARHLNQQPGSRVSAWYEWLFSIFYRGPVEPVVPQENLLTTDRAVLYLNQVQRDIPGPNVIHYFRTRRRPEHTVRLAGIDYAWVYPGPVVGFGPDPPAQFASGGDFGGELRLLGYDLSSQARSGQPLSVTLHWRVENPPPADRFVFVRLLDARGRIWASADSPPVMGLWPVARWQPDMLIEDAHELSISPGTPPGTYQLEVGVYDPDSGQTLPASGQPVGRGGGLLLGQVPVEWQPMSEAPKLANPVDVRLAPNARLIGHSDLPPSATTGDQLPVQLAWREARPWLAYGGGSNDLVWFEWRKNGQSPGEQLGELPIPIEDWGRRAVLLSQHEVIVPPMLETGEYELWVGLHTGSDPAGEPFLLGRVAVAAPAHNFELPAGALTPDGPARMAPQIRLAGYQIENSGQGLDLTLYWQTGTALPNGYKVFAQLLGAGDTVVAQSDSIPAAGQRPATGWLPGEIITDPHTLSLPPDLAPGSYRLIAGLYDPLTGERRPVVGEDDNMVADAISITEIRAP